MSTQKKLLKKVRMDFRLEEDIADRLHQEAAERRIAKSVLVRQALMRQFADWDKGVSQNL